MKTEALIIKLYGTVPESIEKRREIQQEISLLEHYQSIKNKM